MLVTISADRVIAGIMHVHVLAFAILKERLGWESRQVSVADGTTVAQLYHQLHGDSQEPSFPVLFAIDQEYVSPDTPLTDGCELAMIPPLGGG